MIQKIAILALFFTIQALVYNIASALSCLVCRLKIERFVLFFGKTILTIHTKYFPITIGCLPSGGYIKYDPDEFSKRSLLVRMLVTLSGPLVTLLCAVFLLGGDPAVRQFTVGFAEIFRGGLAPYEQGLVLIRDFFRVADQSLFLAYGIFATKLTALNLLPLPGLAGGCILRELAGPQRQFRYPDLLSAINALVILPLVISWALALISYFRHL